MSHLTSERVALLKALAFIMFSAALFNPLFSGWFALFFGGSFSIFVYLMIETQPHAVYMFVFFVKYFRQRLSKRIRSVIARLAWGSSLKEPTLKVDRTTNHTSLTYYDPNNDFAEHVFMFRKQHVSNDLIIFTDAETGEDVTSIISPYLGPLQNFHGSPLSPDDFGLSIVKVFRDGDVNMMKTFTRLQPFVFVPTD